MRVVIISVAYVSILALYRLFLSPIAAFPGPPLARLTYLTQWYYDWVKDGQYYLQIEEMHKKYGPIVRVTPSELHIRDSNFHSKLYVTGAVRKSDSYHRFTQGTGFEDITLPLLSHDKHRALRGQVSRLFTRAGVSQHESRIVARIQVLSQRMYGFMSNGKPVNLHDAFSSLAADAISVIFHEESTDYLGDPDFNTAWYNTLKMGTATIPLLAQLPWLARVISAPVARYILERATPWRIFDDKSRRQMLKSKSRPTIASNDRSNATVFDNLFKDNLFYTMNEQTFTRSVQLIQQGAVHNVSLSLAMTIYCLLCQPDEQEKLKRELEPSFSKYPERLPSFSELESLPHLSACIKEGLRLSVGALVGIPRVSPDVDLAFDTYTIPKGTPVSMTPHWMHMDPDVFPNPSSFEPSRWSSTLTEPEELSLMGRYFVPFGKGSRSCIGVQLAYLLLYQTLAHLFRPGAPRLLLHETDISDVTPVRGFLFSLPKKDSKGLRVILVNDSESTDKV
ncbi:cytochrome P450 [Aspergillus sergii]|uniref:Cytochrome P450 n=1 Tax=Aspergillus sergii TaxID=1034303 RepID=A0A5N6X7A4_9EURO|nr:cytochrome P450 [Aspergillus sergii]